MGKIKVSTTLVLIVLLATAIVAFPKALQWTSEQWANFNNPEDPGENPGSITGEATIAIFDSNGEIISQAMINWYGMIDWGNGGTPDPPVETTTYIPPEDPLEKPPPPKTTQPIFTDAPSPPPDIVVPEAVTIKFTLHWVEIRASYVQQPSLKVLIKAKGLLENGAWSSELKEKTIEASVFTFTDLGSEVWTARMDTETSITVNIDDFVSAQAEQRPVQLCFYYYATGLTYKSNELTSGQVKREVIVENPSLRITGG